MKLVKPALEYLDSYANALRKGWYGDHGDEKKIDRELAEIAADPMAVVARKDDPDAKGAPIEMPDGTFVPRIPGYNRWMWDGEVVGSVNFRWQNGTTDLPRTCLGHIGYSVIPAHQKKGYATCALSLILPDAWAMDMPFVELTTNVTNTASQKVIANNGGVLIKEFITEPEHGSYPSYLWRIYAP